MQLAELNEAFACVAALATRELGLDPDIVNVNGGAVALGHPLGNTGTRMIVTLIHELQKRGQEIGLTGACVGGGQGAGSVIKVEALERPRRRRRGGRSGSSAARRRTDDESETKEAG